MIAFALTQKYVSLWILYIKFCGSALNSDAIDLCHGKQYSCWLTCFTVWDIPYFFFQCCINEYSVIFISPNKHWNIRIFCDSGFFSLFSICTGLYDGLQFIDSSCNVVTAGDGSWAHGSCHQPFPPTSHMAWKQKKTHCGGTKKNDNLSCSHHCVSE